MPSISAHNIRARGLSATAVAGRPGLEGIIDKFTRARGLSSTTVAGRPGLERIIGIILEPVV